MRRLVCALLLLALAIPAAAAAGSPIRVLSTIYAPASWTEEIVSGHGDHFEIRFLTEKGVDIHSFQPSVEDMVAISNCDLFLYVGGPSEAWVADALGNSANPDRVEISLLEAMRGDVLNEEIVEGMQAEPEEETAPDEHIDLSLRNAAKLTGVIADAIAEIDPDYADDYRSGAQRYQADLNELDAAFAAAAGAAAAPALLFADRFPFRYMMADYGVEYYAAFPGCSAETEASFETVKFLTDKAGELNLRHICVIETSDGRLAETIRRNAGRGDLDIVTFDSMQNVNAAGAEQASYLERMRGNLESFVSALS
ncbi:MAG: zinc ABC transporter substrate-binding protein [Clostridia bacterium]|nr:zinc ABC transporter substrate-binding protein [Clostridia bacterium]